MSDFTTMTDSIWGTVNQIEESCYKLKNVANVLEIMAVAEVGEPESGALWLMRDNIIELTDKIEAYTQDLLDCRREIMDAMNKPKKGKKIKIQDAPQEGNFSKAEIQKAIKKGKKE